MDIVIIAQYLRDITDFSDNNSRFVYLAKMLCQNQEHQVEIITSDFEHGTKSHFKQYGELPGVTLTVLHESGYPTNICLRRFASHAELARNVREYLDERRRPDVVYAAIPSLDVANAAAAYCDMNDVRFIVDIQDLWPEAFRLKFDVPYVSDAVFLPFQRTADAVYRQADEIIAVSDTYAERGMSVNYKCEKSHTVFLGTDFSDFDRYKAEYQVEKPERELWIGYVGTLGASYDITCVSHAIRILNEDPEAMQFLNRLGYDRIVFQVMGDGPQREEFEEDARSCGIDHHFTGTLPYPEMVGRLCCCDAAVNPINHGAAQSIINKVGDYAAAGLSVFNTLENREYRALIKQYQCGFNCKANDAESVAKAIKKWMSYDRRVQKQVGRNSRRLGEERFDRRHTYQEIVDLILADPAM